MEVTDEIVTTQEIHMEQPVPIQPQTATTSSTSSNTSHIKLPGITYIFLLLIIAFFYCNCCNFISIIGFFLLIYSSYEILGGATLVAVTDRNVDQIIKPKTLEKPHVTITIGDKQQAMMDPLAIGNF